MTALILLGVVLIGGALGAGVIKYLRYLNRKIALLKMRHLAATLEKRTRLAEERDRREQWRRR